MYYYCWTIGYAGRFALLLGYDRLGTTVSPGDGGGGGGQCIECSMSCREWAAVEEMTCLLCSEGMPSA